MLGPHRLVLLVGFCSPCLCSGTAVGHRAPACHAVQEWPTTLGSAPRSSLLLQAVAGGCWGASAPSQELLLAISTASLHPCLPQLPPKASGWSVREGGCRRCLVLGERKARLLFYSIIPCYCPMFQLPLVMEFSCSFSLRSKSYVCLREWWDEVK